MSLTTGTRLGPYEIIAPLGAGGMGEVYRARDPRLGRDVAIKVLPRAVAGDPERQQRFEAEARAAGALNHPNIVTLHDVGADGGVPYLVTEVLEGETLRALIVRGPLAAKRAVSIIVQVANGLSAAHAKGIVHRDLKPENLFVLPDGRVKILDFGIAKLTRGPSADLGETTPVFASLTVAGTIMGTVSYMAPEQLRDLPVDHRADLFALGAILYELLSGTQAFEGDTAADRVSAILTAEPPPLVAAVEREVPGIGAVVTRLLAKRPEGRLESAGDLAFTLELLAGRSAPAGTGEAAAPAAPPAGPNVRFRPLTFRDGELFCARFAPDGQTFVYQAAVAGEPSEIFLARVESPDARSVGLQDTDLQAVSSTAELAVTLRPRDIGGFIRLGTLARVPLVGGRPRELAHDVFHADWLPDGKSLAAIRKVGVGYQLEAPLGTVIHKTNGWMSNIRCSPDGKQIAFLDHRAPGSNAGCVCVIRPGERFRRLSEERPTISNLVWRPDGEEIWFAAQGEDSPDGVYAVTLAGKVRHVYSAPGYGGVEDLAANGDALFLMISPRMRMETSTRSEGREAAVDLSWLDWSLLRDVSADGSMVLFDETGIASGGVAGVYLRPIDGEPAARLGDGVCSAISDDGHFVLGGDLSGPNHFSIIPIGAGEVRVVPTGDLSPRYGGWLPGGREVVVVAAKKGEGGRLYRVEIESAAIRPLHDQVVALGLIIVSPDGSQVIARGEDGALALFPVDGGAPRPFPELAAPWRTAGWMGDSKSFFAFRGGAVPTQVFRVDAESGAKEPWVEIDPVERSGVSGINTARFTRDGERYVCSYTRIDSALFHARGLR
jgi:eukaryotic-like serine/threonine-protein kinase